ncbi:MAG: nucleotide sugar dehydrogenase [Planctomycetes bacterium]|nr:nucleotide sugar dehydrogenase [Planctomycetota bacterium]
MESKSMHVAVIGGGGHVGLPLSIMLAKKGFNVVAIDSDVAKVEMLKRRVFPFIEEGGQELLNEVKENNLVFCTDYKIVAKCDVIILTVGTPVDEHLNPDVSTIYTAIDQIKQYLHDGQVIILRSTLFPGTSEKVLAFLRAGGLGVGVSYCPERIAQGTALKEMSEFPQLISGSDSRSLDVARRIFSSFAPEVIELCVKEAELAKLFTNVWRYIKFSIANQFYMIAEEKGQDFYRIYNAITKNYPRTLDFPTAGLPIY